MKFWRKVHHRNAAPGEFCWWLKWVLLIWVLLAPTASRASDARGIQFVGFTGFGRFEKSPGDRVGELVLTSPEIPTQILWNELVCSWNAEMAGDTYLKVEARAVYAGHASKYYVMGLWSANRACHPRESVPNQRDSDGDVATDTLMLKQGCERVQVRLTLGGEGKLKPKLKFLGLCLADARATPPVLPPNRLAWGKAIPVPERSQMMYPNGYELCSPTTVSMILSYWSHELKRPELDRDVPEVVDGVYDPQWKGTGNWSFNTAYAGSCPRMRAYVTRLSDVSELEAWVAHGIPVGLSVCYNKLRGKEGRPSGHLVVCVGFTSSGDVVINDPGTRLNVRKTFPRKNLIAAWAYSRNAVYLIYPENAEMPKDRFGHWDSWTSRQSNRYLMSGFHFGRELPGL